MFGQKQGIYRDAKWAVSGDRSDDFSSKATIDVMSRNLELGSYWKEWRRRKEVRLREIETVQSYLNGGKGPMIPMGKWNMVPFECKDSDEARYREWLPFNDFGFYYARMSTAAESSHPTSTPTRQIAFQHPHAGRINHTAELRSGELRFTQDMDLVIMALWDALEQHGHTGAPVWIYNPARQEQAFPNLQLSTQLVEEDELKRKAELAKRFLYPRYLELLGHSGSGSGGPI